MMRFDDGKAAIRSVLIFAVAQEIGYSTKFLILPQMLHLALYLILESRRHATPVRLDAQSWHELSVACQQAPPACYFIGMRIQWKSRYRERKLSLKLIDK